MTERERQALRRRIIANCSDIHGLTRRQYEKHIDGIVRVVERAKEGKR